MKVRIKTDIIFDTGRGSIWRLECIDYPGIFITKTKNERKIQYNGEQFKTIGDAIKNWEFAKEFNEARERVSD